MQKCIANNITNTITIKKSDFICSLFYVSSKDECERILKDIKKEHSKANHSCYAYIIDNEKKCSDDGEPSNTAGKPMLDVLEKNELNYILAVVTRYFGGIKLGASGLIRAYSHAVSSCLGQADISKLIEGVKIEVRCTFNINDKVNHTINKYDIIECKTSYDSAVNYSFILTTPESEKLKDELLKIDYKISYEIKSKTMIVKELDE